MTPPEAPADGAASPGTTPPAVSVCLTTLTKRSDFLRAARARRQTAPGFILQARRRGPDEPDPQAMRVGFTASKKVGNAVARNRAKRRLRAIARQVLPVMGRTGWDYVLVARAGATVSRPFDDLLDDLSRSLHRIHEPRS